MEFIEADQQTKGWVLAMSTPYFDKAEDKINRLKAEGHKEVRVYENIPFQSCSKRSASKRKVSFLFKLSFKSFLLFCKASSFSLFCLISLSVFLDQNHKSLIFVPIIMHGSAILTLI